MTAEKSYRQVSRTESCSEASSNGGKKLVCWSRDERYGMNLLQEGDVRKRCAKYFERVLEDREAIDITSHSTVRSPWFNVNLPGVVREANAGVFQIRLQLTSANGEKLRYINQLLFVDRTTLAVVSENSLCRLAIELGCE